MALLTINDLSISFANHQNQTDIVKHISLSIDTGELVALVGESGSGKSLSALSVGKLLPKQTTRYPSGTITFDGTDILSASEKHMQHLRGNDIAFIFQEPMTSLNPLHTIEKQLREALTIHQSLSEEAIQSRIKSLLEAVELTGLSTRLNAYPHELSGGQRQRIMIAMALANNPKLLIADEPTTALDANVQQSIMQLLKSLQKKHQLSILLITHNLALVEHIADHVYVMKDGTIIEHGTTEALFKNPNHSYTQQLLFSKPSRTLINIEPYARDIIRAEHISVAYTLKKSWLGNPLKTHQAVNDFSFTLREGETLGVIGESGSGKTTLAMALLKLTASEGTIHLLDKPISTMSKKTFRTLRQHLQIVFQDPFASLNPRMTIEQILSEGLIAHHLTKTKEERKKRISEALTNVQLPTDILDRFPHEFSGGQRQRIAIARALVLNPNCIILDEPTSALDVTTHTQIIDLLLKLQSELKLSYIFITHDLSLIRHMCHHVMVLKEGNVVESAATEEIFAQPSHPYTQALLKLSA